MLTRQVLFMIFAFIVSFAFTFATTPLVRRFAFKIGAIDIPKDNRRMHKKPTPRIGGLAIIFGFTVATLCFAQPSRQLYGTLAGAAIIAVMGVIDDCKNLPAKLKFVIQIIAALVVVFAGDIKIDVFTNPNFLSDNPYWVLPEWLSVTLTVIWIVFITNAVNFIDGLDGLAAGVSAIMSISLVFISIRVGEYSIAILGIALMGSCFGFLPFNFNPAKIFMGDTGALFLGFILACISIQGFLKLSAIISFAVPIIVLGLPIFDTLFAIIRRVLTGRSPMSPDRGHLHHRLLDMGFSQKQTVAILYTITAVLCLTAVVISTRGYKRGIFLILSVMVIILASLKFMSELKNPEQNSESCTADSTDEIKIESAKTVADSTENKE